VGSKSTQSHGQAGRNAAKDKKESVHMNLPMVFRRAALSMKLPTEVKLMGQVGRRV
jgi:hypothetical protein